MTDRDIYSALRLCTGGGDCVILTFSQLDQPKVEQTTRRRRLSSRGSMHGMPSRPGTHRTITQKPNLGVRSARRTFDQPRGRSGLLKASYLSFDHNTRAGRGGGCGRCRDYRSPHHRNPNPVTRIAPIIMCAAKAYLPAADMVHR